jgi:hypothetical protein
MKCGVLLPILAVHLLGQNVPDISKPVHQMSRVNSIASSNHVFNFKDGADSIRTAPYHLNPYDLKHRKSFQFKNSADGFNGLASAPFQLNPYSLKHHKTFHFPPEQK